ncbi:helix-turn-helix domain-containing protein [Sphingomonas oryzagri]
MSTWQQPSLGTVAGRLKAERQRLGMSVAEMAAIVGVKKAYQARRERGEVPLFAESLAAFHKAGVDVLFVVTGRRQAFAADMQWAPAREIIQDDLARLAPTDRRQLLLVLLSKEFDL